MKSFKLRRFLAALFATILVVGVSFSGMPAYAQSPTANNTENTDSSGTNAIWSGLWAGVNMATGSGFSGTSTKSSSNSTNTSSQSSTSSTTNSSSITASQSSANTYAALGDSVAAGVGLANPVMVPSAETRCGRTHEAYAYQVASAMNLPLVHAACSGATAGDLFTEQRSGSPNLPPQLDAAFSSGKPQLITITAGANDAHWVQFISACYYTNCASAATTRTANAYLLALQAKLYILFGDIWLRSGGTPPTTVVTGYYNPVSAQCTAAFNSVTQDEINWINGEVNALNQTIQGVASVYSFVRFAPVSFTGHDICSGNSWVQGPNDPQPFHPTATGQQAIAGSVLTSLGR